MKNFERFSALVERSLVNGWRNATNIEGADGILIGYKDMGDEWEFTFSVRVDEKWHPSKKRCQPVDMSGAAWEVSDDEKPSHKALSMALEMCGDIRREIDYVGSPS